MEAGTKPVEQLTADKTLTVGRARLPIGGSPDVRPQYQPGRPQVPGPSVSDHWLASIDKLLPKQGRYWYLASKMSGLPGFNYPEFYRLASLLRSQDYPIVSPAEFEHESHRKRIEQATGDEDHDAIGTPWQDCLARDLAVVANPRCIGVIVFGQWYLSKGALLETHVADGLGKPIFELTEDPLTLTNIDRAAALRAYDNLAQISVRQYGHSLGDRS